MESNIENQKLIERFLDGEMAEAEHSTFLARLAAESALAVLLADEKEFRAGSQYHFAKQTVVQLGQHYFYEKRLVRQTLRRIVGWAVAAVLLLLCPVFWAGQTQVQKQLKPELDQLRLEKDSLQKKMELWHRSDSVAVGTAPVAEIEVKPYQATPSIAQEQPTQQSEPKIKPRQGSPGIRTGTPPSHTLFTGTAIGLRWSGAAGPPLRTGKIWPLLVMEQLPQEGPDPVCIFNADKIVLYARPSDKHLINGGLAILETGLENDRHYFLMTELGNYEIYPDNSARSLQLFK